MNRIDFMNQLESLLQNISPAERVEAIQYYNDYFNDAGVESEQDVIEALGNPAKVAENIKKDLYGSAYAETTYQRASSSDRAVVEYGREDDNQENEAEYGSGYGRSYQSDYQGQFNKSYENSGYGEGNAQAGTYRKEKKMSSGMLVIIIIVCILASPIGIGLVAGVFSALVGLGVAWFSTIIGVGAAALALMACCLGLVIGGFCLMFISPPVGVGMIGCGLFCAGVGILCMMLTIAMAGIATPAIIRGIARVCKAIFKKRA